MISIKLNANVCVCVYDETVTKSGSVDYEKYPTAKTIFFFIHVSKKKKKKEFMFYTIRMR